MTTPANPNPPLGDPDDSRGLPTYEIPWQQTGYRDENARLLVFHTVRPNRRAEFAFTAPPNDTQEGTRR